MSSGNLSQSTHPELFAWEETLDPAGYLFATYRISSACGIEEAARGMAMEQSAATVSIPGFVFPERLRDWTIRVRAITKAAAGPEGEVPSYTLSTEVYPGPAEEEAGRDRWDVELAIPLRLLNNRPAQLMNVILGELPRLGFLTSFKLIDAALPGGFGSGPGFGVAGIRGLLGNPRGPLLGRSMRPGWGSIRQPWPGSTAKS